MAKARMLSVVVGAGPAGLLFACSARLMFLRNGGDLSLWPLHVIDKRSSYVRTHRLRIPRDPLVELQADLDDPGFDKVIDFLVGARFSPAVNEIEGCLAELVDRLSIRRSVQEATDDTGLLPVKSIPSRFRQQEGLPDDAPVTVIGADSVHSTVRRVLVPRGGTVTRAHQTVARLRLVGDDLPAKLGALGSYRTSKVLGSLVDYRLNPSGFAEVDVFLTEDAEATIGALGATQAEAVLLSPDLLGGLDLPLFASLVEHLLDDVAGARARVELLSTFKLEHQFSRNVAFLDRRDRAAYFLVGDAAVSLPFFRGMSSLVQCVHRLAAVHQTLLELPNEARLDEAVKTYSSEVTRIRRSEIAVVEARARLVRGAREFARVSALLPFPLQTWFLSVRQTNRPPARFSAGAALNATAALVSFGFIAAYLFSGEPAYGWVAVIVQAAGGSVYRAAQELEAGPDTLLRRIWLTQISGLLVVGAGVATTTAMVREQTGKWWAALVWLGFGYIFVLGLLLCEWFIRRWFSRAAFEEEG